MALDTRIYDFANRLLQCAEERLTETLGGVPGRACVIAGALAWDSCEGGCDGQLTVALNTSFPSSNFPTPATNTATQYGAGRCGQPLVVWNMTVTILRCVPTGGMSGEPPSCEALTASALSAVQDAAAVQSGIICCLTEALREKDSNGTPVITGFTVGNQDMVGPEGGCGGSSLSVQVGLLAFCPCSN